MYNFYDSNFIVDTDLGLAGQTTTMAQVKPQ